MNSLSWMLYLADVAGSLTVVLTVLAVMAALAGIGTIIFTAASHDWEHGGKQKAEPSLKVGWKAGKGFWKVALPAALAAALIPSQNTVYAIAASQVGERVVHTPTADKAVRALNAWLDRQISGDSDKKH